MKLSTTAVDSAIIEQGEWVDHPFIAGVKVKVRGTGNADFRRLSPKLTRPYTPAQREDVLPVPDQDHMRVELIVETILLDWSGVEEDDGSPLIYSKERARQILSDPDLRIFLEGIDQAATVVATRTKKSREEAAKNLASGSDGTLSSARMP